MKIKNAKIKDAKTRLTSKACNSSFITEMRLYSDEDGYGYDVIFDMQDKTDVDNLKKLMWYAGVTEIEDLNGVCLGDVEYKSALIFPTKQAECCSVTEPMPMYFEKQNIK